MQTTPKNEINVVIGSWGSYNNRNERALGSSWLCLNDFKEWEEIEEELKKQGFKLEEIDQELFIQDISGIELENADFTNPKYLFETLLESGIFEDDSKMKLASAYIEAEGYNYFAKLVEENGEDWDNDIYLHDGTLEDYAYEYIEEMYGYQDNKTFEFLQNFIDYEAVANWLDTSGSFYETSYGLLEIC